MPERRIPIRNLWLLGLCWTLAGAVQPARAVDRPGLSPQERLRQLRPLYERVKKDAALKALDPGRLGKRATPEALDRYLKALPLSPLEWLKIDMNARRYEVMIPKYLDALHAKWVGLHREEARRLYGDEEVDSRLYGAPHSPGSEPAPRGAERGLPLKATPGNHNVAGTSFPAPEEYQGEIQIAANPNDLDQIVAAANTWDAPSASCGDGTIAIFFSGNAGTGWGYTCAPDASAFPSLPACTGNGNVFGSDPALAWNANGEVFLNYMLICSPNATDFWFAMVVARSADGGATWSGQGVVKNSWTTPNQVEDKNFYAIDTVAGSTYNGRHYTCWDRNNNEKVAYSTDNGVSWTEVDLPSPSGGGLDLGCDVAVDKSGRVHAIFNTLTCGALACTNTRLFYTTSGDGGSTWTTPTLLRDYNLTEFSAGSCPLAQDDRCIGTLGAIDVDRSGGACDGWVYVTYGDFDTGQNVEDTDVWLLRGAPGFLGIGTIWLSPVRINTAGLAESIQFHPTLAVDQYDGQLVAAWHDGRNHPNNKLIDIYYGTSRDCGASFSNAQLTSATTEFNNSTRTTSNENSADNLNYNPNQYGEYLGLDVQGSKMSVAWTDTRHYYPGSTNESQKENLGFEQRSLPQIGVVKTHYSVGTEDGWVQESSETSGVGDYSSLADVAVGDNNLDEQRKGILSFDTKAIPDAVTILFVRLKVKRKSLTGTDPFTTHGNLQVDVKSGTFGLAGLEVGDFESASTASGVCTLPDPLANGDWAECQFNASGIAALNKTGRTQVRLRFSTGDNDDLGYDSMSFYGGEAAEVDRPQLIVTYE